MINLRNGWLLGMAVACMAVVAAGLTAAEPAPADKDIKDLAAKAADFLKTRQAKDGSFSSKFGGPGITALVAAALLRNGYNAEDPVVAKCMEHLSNSVQKDGGIYDKALANYTTSVALVTFVEANTKGQYDTLVKNATKFLKTLQYDDSLVEEKDVKFGGFGYDAKKRPDLSNTQYSIEAMLAAGVPKNDPAIQRALKFISRCQNLPGETNDQPFARRQQPTTRAASSIIRSSTRTTRTRRLMAACAPRES